MKPVLFEIFGLSVDSWSFFVMLGILILVFLYIFRLRKLKTDEKSIDKILIITAICGAFTYLGASFFDNLWHSMSDAMINGKFHPELFSYNSDAGGVTFEGGIVTGLLSLMILFPIVMKKQRLYMFTYIDTITICILVAHAFGRIGCFFAGCCYGKETDSIFGIMYPTVNGIAKVFPTQLYEAGFLFIAFFVFFFFIKKNYTEKYLITYGIFRFLLEYLRGDNRGSSPFGFLSPSQLMSIIMIVGGIIVIFVRRVLEKKAQLKYDLNEKNKDTIENKEILEKQVRFYEGSYKNFFYALFHKPKVDGKKYKIGWHSDIIDLGHGELLNKEHLVFIDKETFEEIPITKEK